MRGFGSWYGEATETLRAAARRKRAAEREAGHRDPVEALSIDWEDWHDGQSSTEDQATEDQA